MPTHTSLPTGTAPAAELWLPASEGALPARAWLPDGPPRAVILGLHGFNDSRDAWELPGPVFAAAGIALYAPDQRGFGGAPDRGRWPGQARLAADASAMLRAVAAKWSGVPLYAMGESMGGALLMVVAASGAAPPVAGWVLSAPAVWGRQQMGPALSAALWVASNAAPGWTLTGREVPIKVVATDNREALIRLARDPLTIRRTRVDALRGLADLMDAAQAAAPKLPTNVLALYGGRDRIVPPDAMRRAWTRMPADARRALYPTGYHLLLRDRDRALPTGDVLAWIADRDGWLPSGADAAATAWLAAPEEGAGAERLLGL
jgi:alpha-beta hydrolase superfamily lysophospholipase